MGLVFLSACENRRLEVKIKPVEPPAASGQSEPDSTSDSVAARSEAKPEADALASEATPSTAALPPVDDDPDALLGLDRDGLEGRLGRPALVRLEDPAEVWQYRGEGCVFDLFLYPDNGSRAVVYLEARDMTAQPIEARSCLRGLLETRAAKPVG